MKAMMDYVRKQHDAGTFPWAEFFDQLCDIETQPGDTWDRNQYHCMGCMEIFLRTRLWRWWLAKKQECTCSTAAVLDRV